MDFLEVENIIRETLADAKVEINDLTGTQDHLGITIISDAFEGKGLLQQHRMVMDILKEKLKSELHAVQLKTLTFAKAKAKGMQI